jgi:FkbM family methyltransferase
MTETNPETKISEALGTIGEDPALRTKVIEVCKTIEKDLRYLPNRSIRDEITAPIVDALHAKVGVLRKKLTTGFVFDFHYRSKIAREFVMSTPDTPDHVWEPQTTKLLLHLSRQARHDLIGGAYFGDQAIPVARELAARNGVCHGFELNADQAEMLAHNAALNGLNNVRVNRIGLWSDDKTQLTLTEGDSFAFARASNETTVVNTTTIDSYCQAQGNIDLDLIMLDIEGGEFEVLKGAPGQLAREPGRAPNIVFEVHRSYVDWTNGLASTEIVKFVQSFGYQVVAVRDFQANYDMRDQPIELIPLDLTYLEGPPHGFNLLAVKQPELLANSIFRTCSSMVSPKLLVHKSPALHHPLGGFRNG